MSEKDNGKSGAASKRWRGGAFAFLLPVLVVGAAAGGAMAAHQPLEFDPSAYENVEPPEPVELKAIDLPEEKGGTATLEITMPEAALAGQLKDGRYAGSALCGVGNDEDWQPYYLVVEIEVSGGKVAGVTDVYGDTKGEIDPAYVYDASENSMYLDRAIEGTGGRFSKGFLAQVEEYLASGEESGGVDTVSGSTYSVVSLVQAYNRAVAEAVAQSGQ